MINLVIVVVVNIDMVQNIGLLSQNKGPFSFPVRDKLPYYFYCVKCMCPHLSFICGEIIQEVTSPSFV